MKTQLRDLNHKSRGLLETVRALQASVGDDLDDNEVTRLLRESALPTEAGFRFLSFSDCFVTLTVPRQLVSRERLDRAEEGGDCASN